MALKDWKRATQIEGRQTNYGFVHKINWKHSIVIRKLSRPENFWVEIYDDYRIKDKKFKTKSQAIRFAKNYMRKH